MMYVYLLGIVVAAIYGNTAIVIACIFFFVMSVIGKLCDLWLELDERSQSSKHG